MIVRDFCDLGCIFYGQYNILFGKFFIFVSKEVKIMCFRKVFRRFRIGFCNDRDIYVKYYMKSLNKIEEIKELEN